MIIGDLYEASAADVAKLPIDVHAGLQKQFAELAARTKRIGNVLDAALEMAYGGQNEPGTSHLKRGGYDVKTTAPKKVSWDADKLNDMAASDELLEWMDWTPKVAESRYKAAPERIQKQLDEARAVDIGKKKFEIKKEE